MRKRVNIFYSCLMFMLFCGNKRWSYKNWFTPNHFIRWNSLYYVLTNIFYRNYYNLMRMSVVANLLFVFLIILFIYKLNGCATK